jgi:M-phase inducer tyrosine phosphatase
MNDPNYVVSRKEDMDQFRKNKLGRYKSYAYGEGPFKATAGLQQQQPHQSKRNTAPSVSANTLFAAANAARTRRGGGLSMLEEDVNSGGLSDDDADIGDSPCPPPTKTASAFKGKKIGSVPLMRAETYGPARFAY